MSNDWQKQGYSEFIARTLNRLNKLDPAKVEKKLWGAAVAVGRTTYGQMSLAIIDKGGFCSRHYHNQKVNTFIVDEGILLVHVWTDPMDCDTREPDITHEVKSGEALTIPINVIHEMEGKTDCIVMEAYHTCVPCHKVCLKDIHRFTTGGLKPSP